MRSNPPIESWRAEHHPDVNRGSEKAAREFALLSLAYHTLIDPQERAFHDQQLDKRHASPSSILHSDNPHAQRAREMQARWDRVVNQILENDRRESVARQRAVFTTVSLFLSTFFVAMIKPPLWQSFGVVGRAILVTLFMTGVWHLIKRLREYFRHYTYKPRRDSLFDNRRKRSGPRQSRSPDFQLLLSLWAAMSLAWASDC